MVGTLDGWVADFSGKPAEVALDLAHFNPGTVGPRHEAKSEGKNRALQEEGFHVGSVRRELHLTGSGVMSAARTACDEHQLAHPDLGVKAELLSRAIKRMCWCKPSDRGTPVSTRNACFQAGEVRGSGGRGRRG